MENEKREKIGQIRRFRRYSMRKRKPGISLRNLCFAVILAVLPCKSPKADPGLAIPSAPAANFLKLVSLELGRGLDADE